ncbi:MAG: cyclase, partial [Bacillota bacterium]
GPAGSHVEWDAQVINDEENSLIAWRSQEGASVDNAGSVRFVPAGDRGTEVRVVLEYIPPAGQIGFMVAKLYGEEPRQQVSEDLYHFKQLMETGEIPSTEGQPQGTCAR